MFEMEQEQFSLFSTRALSRIKLVQNSIKHFEEVF